MTSAQRVKLTRTVYFIQLFLIIVCGLYILYVAYQCENAPQSPDFASLNNTYLMGRRLPQLANTTTYSVFSLPFVYETLLSCREDRAPLESDSSARQLKGTCSGVLG